MFIEKNKNFFVWDDFFITNGKMRDFFKEHRNYSFGINSVKAHFEIDELLATRLLEFLKQEDFLIKDEKDDHYKVTSKGSSFASASGKLYKRETVKKTLKELLKRARLVNKSKDFIVYVDKVIVFGSYLGNKKMLGDLDIILRLSKKRFFNKKLRENLINGSFKTAFDPDLNVYKFIQNKSKIISLVMEDDEFLKKTSYKIVYERKLTKNELAQREKELLVKEKELLEHELLEKEMELIRKERELLQRENELLKQELLERERF